MFRRHANELSEAARIEISFFELRAHRHIPATAVVTTETRNVVSYDDAIVDVELPAARFHHPPRHLVAQNNRVLQRLKPDLMNIGKTDSAGHNLQEDLPLANR